MGRKAHPLIIEYFERGAKLKDNSNRYEHTCKACGELFPKGRIEVLLGHILKRCSALSSGLRQRLVLQAHDLPLTDGGPELQRDGVTPTNAGNPETVSNAVSSSYYNALNVLADASQTVESNYHCPDPGARNGVPLDPSLDVDSFASSFLNISDDNVGPRIGTSFDSPPSPVISPLSTTTTKVEQPSSQTTTSSMTEPLLSSQGPCLESIAASANDIMGLTSGFDLSHGSIAEELLLERPSVSGATGPAIHMDSTPRSFTAPLHTSASSRGLPASSGSFTFNRRLAMHLSPKPAHFIAEFGTPTKPMKPKVRGKFTPDRRREIKDIRKLGACMRCRMLKKTCSGGTPCQACAAIDSPRVWKKRCVRTKLVNEFGLFSVGLLSTLCYREVSGIKERTNSEPLDGFIQAFHFDHYSSAISFKALRLTVKASISGMGGSFRISASPKENDCGLIVVDSGNDEAALSLQIEQYLRDMHSSLVAAESSPILRSTLHTAEILLRNQGDSLLERAMGLWSSILVLVDPNLDFKLVARTGAASDPDSCGQAVSEPGLALTPLEWPKSTHIINLQLRALVEKQAARLARGIMIDLERRLMQKPRDDESHTFIAAVIFMNCVERICWQFGRYASLSDAVWPLEKSPADFAREGDRFADILDGMLELRSVPPRTTVDLMSNIIMAQDVTRKVIVDWFEKIAITPGSLKVISDRKLEVHDCRSLDVKLFTKFIRPEKEQLKKEVW